MSREIVAIEHHDKKHKEIVMISWIMGNSCNYRCSYCPPELNSGSAPWVDKETIFSFVERVINHYEPQAKQLYFEFSGGEVTCDRNFVEIVSYLKKRGCWVGIISNGAQKMTYWEQIMPHLDHICLSFHPEFGRSDHFKTVVDLLYPKVTTHVNILMHPDYFDECAKLGKAIATSIRNSSIAFQPIMKTLGIDTEQVTYSEEQKQELYKLNEELMIPWDAEVKTYRGLLDVHYDDGSVEVVSAPTLFAEDKTDFRGFHCAAGVELLSIFYDGNIYPCWGMEGEKRKCIGHVSDTEIRFPTEPTFCDVPICFDICDIMTSRERRCSV